MLQASWEALFLHTFIHISVANCFRFQMDSRILPVLWHQALLTFVQRYKADISTEQRDALLELLRKQSHPTITNEVCIVMLQFNLYKIQYREDISYSFYFIITSHFYFDICGQHCFTNTYFVLSESRDCRTHRQWVLWTVFNY